MAAHFGRRLRKGAATTAVAALAVAALSASEAPGATGAPEPLQTSAGLSTPVPEASADGNATGNSPYYTDLPPLDSPAPSPSAVIGTPVSRGEGEAGIPATVLAAYKKAEAELRASKPGCNLPWQLLAAIGKVESGQARGGRVYADGTTVSPIIGPQLDGNGFALIKDTDHGAYDGNSSYDQAIGPMQFIPSTWAWAGRDGNDDGKADPNNVYDAALAAGHYLCRNGWDLSQDRDLHSAILSYNNSSDYLALVLNWVDYYRRGTHSVPDGAGGVPAHRSDDGFPRASGPTAPHTSRPTPESPKPGKPSRPGKPGGGDPSTPGEPSDPTTPTTPPTSPAPTPSDTVHHLTSPDQDGTELTATAGDAFERRIGARAVTKDGAPVATVRVRFTITGDTDTTFAGGEKVAVVRTDAKGVALAPRLRAGEKAGTFKVTSTVVGRQIKGVDYTATVTPRPADKLVRTADTPQTCVPGGEFAGQIEVKATYKGAPAAKVGATATLVKSADSPVENIAGPYFKDANGQPVRTLTGLTTDANGLLTLPKLYADLFSGTYLLRVTTPGGGSVTVELKVAAGETASASPSPSPSASS
ncbi:lytic transglycosylase domain-containing protein [Streptomyces sp. NBC_00566]|uniref:lytic transglycosylase domain-containing protein n=1 Tax=Streptomyces sp. NBC_00566 TaxID=2975778 RepID=UPI002E801042|nr:lytic murein transglycosylase [Streptomyces sp. NBC_00566]WUB89252.1 lytic murein transglycosylase [Streptomyces sp. NBC_00566]